MNGFGFWIGFGIARWSLRSPVSGSAQVQGTDFRVGQGKIEEPKLTLERYLQIGKVGSILSPSNVQGRVADESRRPTR
jgi:hypothetical protein